MDFQDFADGLKHVFRQDPTSYFVGEMRDPGNNVAGIDAR